jgi:hypothetical protein
MHCVKPLAAILDIFKGEKGCFLGIGVVLPLLTKLKKQLKQRVFPIVGPLRDKILARIEDRYNIIEVNVKNSRSNNLTITFKITGSVIYLLTTRT